MEGKTKWAVCGLGRISRRFVRVVKSLKDAEVAACVSSSKKRAEAYRKKYGLEYAFTYDELAQNPSVVDAVYVCSDTRNHKPNAVRFLNAKIPVLCEKAFSYNYESAAAMTDCAKANDTLLMEAMWTQFLPATRYVRECVQSGRLGKIKSVSGWFWAGIGHLPKSRVFTKESCGGSVLDLAVYLVTYCSMLLGAPNQIRATGKVVDGVDRYCNFEFVYADGVKAKLHSSFRFLAIKENFIIECEKGKIVIPRFYGAKRVIVKPTRGKTVVKKFEKIDGFSYEIRHFGELIRNNSKESPVMTHEATLDTMKILEELNRQLGVNFEF